VLTLLAIVSLAGIIAWEIARPTLPVPFELAIAARSPSVTSWVGRLPMALASIAGSLACYMFLTRLSAAPSDRSAGIYGVAILATP
jgi:hypothetical protein